MSCNQLVQFTGSAGMEYVYQVEALKDDYEELEEYYALKVKELKSKTKEYDALDRKYKQQEQESATLKLQFKQILESQEEENSKLLIRIQQLEEELEKHKTLLEESEKARQEILNKQLPVADEVATARETNKQTREYHYKWKVSEQENAVLQTAVSRLENQVARYKESLCEAETIEGELKAEKRKLLRELRETQAKVEELETNNSHLQKRLDRIRSRNLLVGDSTPANTANNITTTLSTTPNTSLNSIPTSTTTTATTNFVTK